MSRLFNEESNEILASYKLESEDNKDSLSKLFGDISSISEKENFTNIHYMCRICLKFPKIIIVDNDKIQLICDNERCKSFNQPTRIKDVYKRLIELKDNNYDIFGCDEPEHRGEKFIYYCKNDCNDNKCGQCGKICEEKDHSLEDLNRDMITKKKRDFIKSKCDKRNEYFKECKNKEIKNFENNYIEDALGEQSFKIIQKDENSYEKVKILVILIQ